MSRIDAAFRDLRAQGRTGLVTYVTGGDPDIEKSRDILVRLDRAGAGMIMALIIAATLVMTAGLCVVVAYLFWVAKD